VKRAFFLLHASFPWKTILKIPIPYYVRGTLEDPSMVQCGSTYFASLWTLP